jgi:hypothetical protein
MLFSLLLTCSAEDSGDLHQLDGDLSCFHIGGCEQVVAIVEGKVKFDGCAKEDGG